MEPVTKKFQVSFKVRPVAEHPSYYGFIWGFLGIVLTARHDFEAEERAKAIVAQLPFEVVGECGGAVPWSKPRTAIETPSEEMFETLGFAYWFIRVPLEEFGAAQPDDMQPWGARGEGPDSCQPG
ncbi:MAG TPA: hypothetical protein VH619_06275 [Verrucomicrobiae bacterium]|jgi:hypothetical protein|nr:hypothetical protein [Verrucomicrobiae bacterium]